jgi:hypothetical protein
MKKIKAFECMLSLPIGCMKFLFPKLFVTILAWANTPIHLSYSLDEVPPSLTLCFAMSQFD